MRQMAKVGMKERAAKVAEALNHVMWKVTGRTFGQLEAYANRIGESEMAVFERRFNGLTARAFLRWHSAYFNKMR